MSDKQVDAVETPIESVPEGFEVLPSGLGFLDALAPLYRQMPLEKAVFGLLVDSQHVNMMGICHGGVIMTLADAVAATGVNLARGEMAGNPTINLSLDFVSSAKQGQWIQGVAQEVNLKRRFGFCSGVIESTRGTVAKFSGTFYLPDHDGLWKDGESKQHLLKPS